MLKTNSKKARENIRGYIWDHAAEYMREDYAEDFKNARELCACIMRAFVKEAAYPNNIRRCGGNMFQVFKDWAQGLAMGNLFCYYYNRPAHDDLARLLDETPEQSAKYTEDQAADCLTRLIFREVWKAY